MARVLHVMGVDLLALMMVGRSSPRGCGPSTRGTSRQGKISSQVLREPLKAALPPWLLFAMFSGIRRGVISNILIIFNMVSILWRPYI